MISKLKFGLAGLAMAVAAAALSFAPGKSLAQSYPTNTPVYMPAAVWPSQTISAIGNSSAFQANGIGTVVFHIGGSPVGLAATIQGSTERAGTITWTNLSSEPGGVSAPNGRLKTITAAGLYKVNAAGYSQLRLAVTALSSGSLTLSATGSPSSSIVSSSPIKRATYSAIVTGLAPAASATDFVTLTGSATTTVRVLRAECAGTSTANATATIRALTRSTANSAGTSAAMAASQHDSTDPAATATALSYTANPTTGTLVGSGLRSGLLTTTTAASSSVNAVTLSFEFGAVDEEEYPILRGVAQVFALNGNGASFSAGTALNCHVVWDEE